MGQEKDQFDIPDRQLLTGHAHPRGMGTELGEAKIVHTMFGRAKVHIVHEHDRIRRIWLISAMTLVALSVLSWQLYSQLYELPSHASANPAVASMPDEQPAPASGVIETRLPELASAPIASVPEVAVAAPQLSSDSKNLSPVAVKPGITQAPVANKVQPVTNPPPLKRQAMVRPTAVTQRPVMAAASQPAATAMQPGSTAAHPVPVVPTVKVEPKAVSAVSSPAATAGATPQDNAHP